MTFLSQLDWRFATKSFDPEKKVSEEDFQKILNAIRMAPTSFGLQPFHVVEIADPALREQLKAVSYGQAQISDASHVLLFCAKTNAETRPEEYVNAVSQGNEEVKQKMQGYKEMMLGAVQSRSEAERLAWSAKQTYIALGFGLAAAAELGIDSCPMEGFDPKAVGDILGLPEKSLQAQAYLTIGYRKEGPAQPKFRFSAEDLFSRR